MIDDVAVIDDVREGVCVRDAVIDDVLDMVGVLVGVTWSRRRTTAAAPPRSRPPSAASAVSASARPPPKPVPA